MTSQDFTITRVRRRLETLQLPVPRPEVLDEIVDITTANASAVGNAAARGYDSGHEWGYKDGWDDGYAAGLDADAYQSAINDIKELAADTGDDNTTGPTAA